MDANKYILLNFIYFVSAASPQFYAAQVSSAEYEKQKKVYTASAVDNLIQSPEYQRRFTMCQMYVENYI